MRPLPGAHRFSFHEIRLFWKAPTSSSHPNFIIGHLLTPGLRSGGFKSLKVLYYPRPMERIVVFQFQASKGFLESPDQ